MEVTIQRLWYKNRPFTFVVNGVIGNINDFIIITNIRTATINYGETGIKCALSKYNITEEEFEDLAYEICKLYRFYRRNKSLHKCNPHNLFRNGNYVIFECECGEMHAFDTSNKLEQQRSELYCNNPFDLNLDQIDDAIALYKSIPEKYRDHKDFNKVIERSGQMLDLCYQGWLNDGSSK